MNNKLHITVLLSKSIELLSIKPNGIYVDGTLGLGGHSEEILKKLGKKGKLIGIDADLENLDFAKKRLEEFVDKFEAVHGNFGDLKEILKKKKIDKVDGILLDLGISSPHVDDCSRGFSFLKEGPLDMRFDKNLQLSAADILNTYDKQELTDILRNYGEESKAWKIAGQILEIRKIKKFETTNDLVEAVNKIYGREKIHGKSVATQTFQALRIAVNQELKVLEKIMNDLPEILNPEGRFVCISYHSLEDRIVKHSLRDMSKDYYEEDPPYKIIQKSQFKILTAHPIVPDETEINENPRSRSAKMRASEKL